MGKDGSNPIARRVFLTKHCAKSFQKVQESDRRKIEKTIEEISIRPELGYPLHDAKFKDADLYSIHSGDFRIIYRFSHNPGELEIWAIAHRSHVYDELLRYRSASA